MTYALGVDIGTSTVTAAIARFGDRDSSVISAVPLGRSGGSASATVVITADGRVVVGDDAFERSASHPERTLSGWISRIGDKVPIVVGGMAVAPEQIFAAVIRWAIVETERREGTAPAAVCITHPTGWGEYRVSLLRRALTDTGLPDALVVNEVDAVVEQHRATCDGATDAFGVYDLSADRLTFSIIARTDAGRWRLTSTESMLGVGGARFDDSMLAHVIASSGDLAGFDATSEGAMADMRRLRNACVRAKEELSSVDEVVLPLRPGEPDTGVHLTRAVVEPAVEHAVRRTIPVVREARRRDRRSEPVTELLLTGGSSRMPLVRSLLAEELDMAVVVDGDPQSTFSFGAARIAAGHVDRSAVEEPSESIPDPGPLRTSIARAYSTAVSAVGALARRRRSAGRPADAAVAPDASSERAVEPARAERDPIGSGKAAR